MDYMTRDESAAWQPDRPDAAERALARTRRRMEATGQWHKVPAKGRARVKSQAPR